MTPAREYYVEQSQTALRPPQSAVMVGGLVGVGAMLWCLRDVFGSMDHPDPWWHMLLGALAAAGMGLPLVLVGYLAGSRWWRWTGIGMLLPLLVLSGIVAAFMLISFLLALASPTGWPWQRGSD
jgi:hypothetical protein